METLLLLLLVVGVSVGALFSNFVLDALYSSAITLLRKRAGCFALMWYGTCFMCPFLMKPWLSLQSVIVEFPGHILL